MITTSSSRIGWVSAICRPAILLQGQPFQSAHAAHQQPCGGGDQGDQQRVLQKVEREQTMSLGGKAQRHAEHQQGHKPLHRRAGPAQHVGRQRTASRQPSHGRPPGATYDDSHEQRGADRAAQPHPRLLVPQFGKRHARSVAAATSTACRRGIHNSFKA
jgi:hypothetical protein